MMDKPDKEPEEIKEQDTGMNMTQNAAECWTLEYTASNIGCQSILHPTQSKQEHKICCMQDDKNMM